MMADVLELISHERQAMDLSAFGICCVCVVDLLRGESTHKDRSNGVIPPRI